MTSAGISTWRIARYAARVRALARRRRDPLLAVAVAMVLPVVSMMFLAATSICRHDPSNQAFGIAKTIAYYRLLHGRLPERLEALTVRTDRSRALLDHVPRDAYGRPYAYLNPGLRNVDGFDVVSAGRDGVFFTGDDEGNWLAPAE